MIPKLKDLIKEAPQIKKVKNVSVQYFGAEYVGEMTFSGYFRKAWLYKKNNSEWFAVIITKNKNRYEIQLGKHKDKLSADKAAEKLIKRNLNKFESINEGPISYQNYATDSKDGASKQFINDFNKIWKKVSIEQSKNPKNDWWKKKAGKVELKKEVGNFQVSEPAGFDKPIKREKIKTVKVSIQIGTDVMPGNLKYALYTLEDFVKDMKKGFSGYKIKKTNITTHFVLEKNGNIYNLSFVPAITGTFVIGDSRL